VFHDGLLYVCTGFGKQTSALAIRPAGTGDITAEQVHWKVSRSMPTTPSLLAVGQELYAVTDQGVASCLEAQTGKVLWTKRLGGNFSASPIYGDGKAYFLSEEGETTVIEPGPQYIELAKNRLGEKAYASPAVIESALLIRTEGHLYRIEQGRP
jgi:outer membrane protein assembly factor BamB